VSVAADGNACGHLITRRGSGPAAWVQLHHRQGRLPKRFVLRQL